MSTLDNGPLVSERGSSPGAWFHGCRRWDDFCSGCSWKSKFFPLHMHWLHDLWFWFVVSKNQLSISLADSAVIDPPSLLTNSNTNTPRSTLPGPQGKLDCQMRLGHPGPQKCQASCLSFPCSPLLCREATPRCLLLAEAWSGSWWREQLSHSQQLKGREKALIRAAGLHNCG